ncbi:MAG TPA: hypothetical protein VFN36_07260 [Solirubrobacteraceae bacterium]|nr:hypothetical protein [Solirubrobacteraceae bacterium]
MRSISGVVARRPPSTAVAIISRLVLHEVPLGLERLIDVAPVTSGAGL